MSTADYLSPNDFQGSDAARINQALRAAAGTGRRVVVPRRNHSAEGERDLWLLEEALLLPGDTVLELNNCHLKLADHCRDNLIRSANCGLGITDLEPLRGIHIYGVGNVVLEGADRPRATGDAGKTLGVHTYGSDAGVAGESQTGDWRNLGVLLAHVEEFSLSHLTLKDTHCWAVSLERCAYGTIRDLTFASSGQKWIDGSAQTILNQDGLDLRLGCHDILIENLSGHTGDDLLALTAIPHPDYPAGSLGSTMVSASADRGAGQDDLRHLIIRNIRGYCQGGHHIVRLLNTSGVRLYDVVLDGLLDTSPQDGWCRAALKIGDSGYGGGVAPLGDTARVLASNIISRSQHTILIGGSLCDSILSNILHRGDSGEPLTLAAGPEFFQEVTVSNLRRVP